MISICFSEHNPNEGDRRQGSSGSSLWQLGQRALPARQLLARHPLPQRKTQNSKRIWRQGKAKIKYVM